MYKIDIKQKPRLTHVTIHDLKSGYLPVILRSKTIAS